MVSRVLDELVDEVFQKFLAAALVFGDLSLLEHEGLKGLEARFAGLDLFADAGVPGAVAVPDKFRRKISRHDIKLKI